MKTNLFDPHKSFLSLKVLWVTVSIHVIAALVTITIIIYNSSLLPNFSYEGINNALNIFKAPLGVMALIIPIVALLAANHRSEQTKEQMRLTSENNDFSNFYKHTAEFESYLLEHSEEKVKISLPRKFHRLAFPDAKRGNFRVSKNITDRIEITLGEIIKSSAGLNSKENWQNEVFLLDNLITRYADSFYIKNYKDNSGSVLNINGQQITVPGGSIKNIIITISTISIKIRDALLFDDRYEPGPLLTKIIEFDYNRIPYSDITHTTNFAPFNFEALLLEQDTQ